FVDPNPDSGSTDEGNVITAALINQASAKHWDLYHYNWSNSSWVPYTGAAAAEAYACYTPSNTTLTFYYDNQRSSRPGTTYDLNTGNYSPGWYTDGTYSNVSEVKFDPSFTNARPTTCHSWFRDMAQLQTIYGLNYLNTSAVTHMVSMFRGCSSLTVLDLSSFSTANVIAMGGMFMGCSNLRTIYAGSGWSTAAVEASAGMFSSCTSLVGGQGTTFNSSHVGIDYAHIDGGPSNPGYFTEWKEAYACYTPSNTTLTFYYDSQRSSRTGTTYDLNTGYGVPLWYNDEITGDVTKVVFDPSFAGARPTTTYAWFYNMYYLESIKGMEYLNTSEVTYMYGMFLNCVSLASLDVSHFNTSKVTDMEMMFGSCWELASLDLSSFNTSRVTDMTKMFTNCYNLNYIRVGSGWSTAAVTSSTEIFNYCTNLVGGQGTTYDANHIDKAYAHIDGGTSNPGYFTDKNASLRGDVDGNGNVNISDVTALIDYLLSGNASGINLSGADCNQDSSVNISDVTALIDYLLSGTWN
ncbi:MAG: BspA family leucine-rich repeat surface protein, partial [Muribaculaceae bacterium]|nr:BspA family leucine-rich repeat surface protein [Muribaculaceae bacterium]